MAGTSNNQLQNKVAIITGGASGIGETTAHLFAENGVSMLVIADIQDELGQKLVDSIGSHRCRYIHCDVTDEEQVKSLVNSTVKDHGRLDIMFSNAGIISSSDQTILNLDLSSFDRVIAVNARGMAACVKHAARAMVEGQIRGSIVCSASVAGSRGGNRTDYHMSKHAVVGLVKSASLQLGVYGIRVNCVSPYGLATPGTCKLYGVEADEMEKLYESHTCLKKSGVLRARHVADAVLFLACSDSEFITGHDLVVDGGFTLGNSHLQVTN